MRKSLYIRGDHTPKWGFQRGSPPLAAGGIFDSWTISCGIFIKFTEIKSQACIFFTEEPVKAIYSDDKDRGPGHGFLHISDASVGNLEELRFSIKRGTDQHCLGPGGWQPAESPFAAQRITLSDDGFDIAVGPEVVDHLDSRENYRLTLMSADGASSAGALRVPEVTYSPVGGGQGIGIAAAPAPKPVPTPPPPPPPAPEPEPEPEPAMDILPPPDPTPGQGKGGSLKFVIIGLLILALAGGGFAAWKFWLNKEEPAKVAEETPPPKPEEKKEEPPKEEPKAPPKPALAQAREHLAGKADPAESVKLAQGLREERDGADASFLLVEDAAQKGSADAMLLTGGYFDPVDAKPAGSIKKDPAAALSWYKKAKAAGSPDADARVAALRSWAQAEAAKGSPEAKALLTQF